MKKYFTKEFKEIKQALTDKLYSLDKYFYETLCDEGLAQAMMEFGILIPPCLQKEHARRMSDQDYIAAVEMEEECIEMALDAFKMFFNQNKNGDYND